MVNVRMEIWILRKYLFVAGRCISKTRELHEIIHKII